MRFGTPLALKESKTLTKGEKMSPVLNTSLENIIDTFFGISTSRYQPNRYQLTSTRNDIVKCADRYELILDVPGISKKDISMKAERDKLTISFDNSIKHDDSVDVLTRNVSRGKFDQSYLLPEDVDNESITAECKDGVLTVKLPMTKKAQGKKISIA